MLNANDVNAVKADLLDAILRSSVPALWENDNTAIYIFNEVAVTVRYHYANEWPYTTPAGVDIIDSEDRSDNAANPTH